jgi:probable HAF family extracellular repeat protein
VLSFAARVDGAEYTITLLEPLPGGIDSYPTAINDLGQVVGYSTLDRTGHVGRSRPVIWDATGRPQELWIDPVFGGIPLDINMHGQVVGRYGSGSGIPLPGPGIPPGGAFIWDPATRNFSDLGDLGGRNVQATGINDLGQVTGSSENERGLPRAFLWETGAGMHDLGTLGGVLSFGTDINNRGQIAGYAWRADDSEHAFLWDALGGMRDLGGTGRSFTRATGLNDHGDVVGYGAAGAFLWSDEEGIRFLHSSATSIYPAWDIFSNPHQVGISKKPQQ